MSARSGSEQRFRSATIIVRCSPEEKAEIEEAAGKLGISAPAFLRQTGVGWARRFRTGKRRGE